MNCSAASGKILKGFLKMDDLNSVAQWLRITFKKTGMQF